jgi:EAL domain-containing protein (putative c-di-GMP-specific phosphodiesterase class I)
VRAIINLGHALDLTVIAEGVETKEQLQYLSALECDVVQGFLFSKALTARAFEELLIEQRQVTSAGEVSATVPLSVESLVPAS